MRDARSIERFIGRAIEWKRIDDFPYVYSALFDERALAAEDAAKPLEPAAPRHAALNGWLRLVSRGREVSCVF